MKPVREIGAILILLLNLSGCSFVDEDLLNREVRDFSRGVVALSAIVQADFSLAEQVNTIAFTDNLRFQMELGGTPQMTLKPLFSTQDIAARQSLLAALDGYAQTLAVVASGQPVASTYSNILGTVENLKSLDSGQFNLSHSLSLADSDQLVSDVGLFEELFILPEWDAKLVPILQKGAAALKKSAQLLYFDFGAVADESGTCSYSIPKNDLENAMSELKLCRGGLRSIVETAINYDIGTWKGKLALLKGNSSLNPDSRNGVIDRLVNTQKLNQNIDQLLSGTQGVLIAMVSAHDEIVGAVTSASSSSVAPLNFVSKTELFHQKVNALAAALKTLETAVSDLSTTSVSTDEPLASTKQNSLTE